MSIRLNNHYKRFTLLSKDDYRRLNAHLKLRWANHIWLKDFANAEDREKIAEVFNLFPWASLQNSKDANIYMNSGSVSYGGSDRDPQCDSDDTRPHYLVQMPWLPSLPKGNEEYVKTKHGRRVHFARWINRLKKIEEALASETFGHCSEISREEAAKRLTCVIGINQPNSLDTHRNEEFWDFITSIPKMNKIALRVIAFLWGPWYPRHRGARSITINDVEVPTHLLYSVDRSYLMVKALCSDRPWIIEKLNEHLAVDSSVDSGNSWEKSVPYQHIRDYIMHSEEMNKFLRLFRDKSPRAPIYLANLDADFSRLKTDDLGLYSHYDRLAQEHFQKYRDSVSVMSTGYRAPDNVHWIIRYGIHLDMMAREKMSGVWGACVYYCEPNFTVRVPDNQQLSCFSFRNMQDPKEWDTESRWFIQNGIANGVIDPKHMLFSAQGAVETAIGIKWHRVKYNSLPRQPSLDDKEVLSSLRGIKQSHLKTSVWGTNVLHGLRIPYSRQDVIGKLQRIHDIFSPIEWMKSIQNNISNRVGSDGRGKQSLNLMHDFFPLFLAYIDRVGRMSSEYHNLAREYIGSLGAKLSLDDALIETIIYLFTSSFISLLQSVNELRKLGLTENTLGYIIALAIATGEAVYQGLQNMEQAKVVGATLMKSFSSERWTVQTVQIARWGNREIITKEEADRLVASNTLSDYKF